MSDVVVVGLDHIQIYNDYYSPILRIKHPGDAMGKPFRECWHEVYHILGPLVDTPFRGGPATWMDDIAPRGIGGVLGTVMEITERVIAERRGKILSELAAASTS